MKFNPSKRLLKQIREAEKIVKSWPKWMEEAAYFASISPPKEKKNG